mgnify:CR=1 FL=1
MKTNWRDELPWQILLLLMVFLMLWPIIFMLSTSLKDLNQVFESTLNPLPLPPTLANYRLVLEDFPIFTYIWNTFFIAAFVTVSKIATGVLAAFAFVYYRFKGKEFIFNSMLLTFFIPITVLIMPNYLLVSRLGLLDTPWGVMLPGLVDGMGIFLMRQTMRGVPKALLEAAILDGARPLLILQDKNHLTLPLALQMFISAEGGSEWGVAMAVATLTSLPPLLLYIFFQKFIINTFMQAGVKG